MKLTERKIKIFLFLLILIVLALPWVLRYGEGNETLMGEFAYYHLKIAGNRDLLFQPGLFNPYHLVLALPGLLFESSLWLILIPFLLGMVSVFLFYRLLKKAGFDLETRGVIMGILVISPVFIYLFTFLNHYALIVFLLLAGFNLLVSKRAYFCLPVFLIMPFFDILTTMVTGLFLIVYLLVRKEKLVYYILGGLVLIVILLGFIFPQPFSLEPGVLKPGVRDFFSDVGGLVGLGGFTLLLAVIGIVKTWKKKRVYYGAYVLVVLFVIFFFLFNKQQNVYLNFILAVFAGWGFIWLLKRKWQLNFIKILSVIILICGLVFSSLSYIDRIKELPPKEAVLESLFWLGENSEWGEGVLSHPEKSFWIEYMGREAFLDYFSPDFEEKKKVMEEVFYSREIKKTIKLLEENKIRYIWIDGAMKEGQVWTKKEEGLLFLFRNERFKNIYNKKGIEIWRLEKEK